MIVEMFDPLRLVLGLFIAVILLIGMVISDIPRDKYRVPKIEQEVPQLEKLRYTVHHKCRYLHVADRPCLRIPFSHLA